MSVFGFGASPPNTSDRACVRRSPQRRLTTVVATALIAGVVQMPAQSAFAANEFTIPALQQTESVPVTAVAPDPPAAQMAKQPLKSTAITWPRAGAAEVELSGATAAQPGLLVGAPGIPVAAAPVLSAGAGGSSPTSLHVELSDHDAAAHLGIDGILISVRRSDGRSDQGKAQVQLDYNSFRNVYGADWGSRLTLIQLPACAMTTPELPECRTTVPVATSNDTKTGKLTAVVETTGHDVTGSPIGPQPTTSAVAPRASQAAPQATVLAATAGASGPEGSYAATSLAPSSSWSVGGNSGSFSWSYPLELPPVPGALSPKIALAYSSSAVDGRTATTNNQSSWIGDGWDYDPGFVERSYTGCAGDKGTGSDSNAPTATGDLCWKSDNATISLNGNSSTLVRDDSSGAWKLSNDDGSRVERLNGTATDTANGDADNEYWKVTTSDGVQYFFGKNRLPGWSAGKPETGSALTVPVFGNQPGEPGHATAFKDSAQSQAWRWQLDYVVDVHGNAMAYFYDQEKNAYAKNSGGTTGTPKADTPYARAATLNRIEYGLRGDQVYTVPPAGKVTFPTADRCLAANCAFDKTNAVNWPDTPIDQSCDLNADCYNRGPSFWSKKRLTGVNTQARQADGSYRDIDSWAFAHDFPAVGDSGGRALWLSSITRTAKAGTQIPLLPVTFGGDLRPNRVDSAEGRPPMNRYRINRISSETGSNTLVTYGAAECTAANLPAPDSNTKLCYPSWWTPEGAVDPVKDWFHKYVVTQVTEDDLVAGSGSPNKVTAYEYLGGAAWRRDNSEFTPDKQRTWNDFRGFQTVRTRVGSSNKSLSEATYFRGLDGDVLANGSARSVPAVQGITDRNEFAGTVRENVTYDRDGGKPATSTTASPTTRTTAARALKALPTADGKPTAVLPAESGRPSATALPPLVASIVSTEGETSKILLADGAAARTTQLTRTFDTYGQVTSVSDDGDTAVTGDEVCIRTIYAAADTVNWFIAYPSSVQTASTSCGTAATPSTVTGESRAYYDNQQWGSAPTPGQGNATRTEVLERYDGATPVYLTTSTSVHDTYGRTTSAKDVNNAETTISYTPAAGSQPTTITSTNPKQFITTTTYDGLRGLPTRTVDANNRSISAEYDALGRATAVWQPGRAKPASANVTFEYSVLAGKPASVTTKTLLEGGAYRTSIALYDGLLRPRQAQEDASGGGRNTTDTFYDSHGRPYSSNASYWTNIAPRAALEVAVDNKVPSQSETEYDGMDRPTASVFKSLNVEKWRSTTTYGPNWSATTPPTGGSPSLSVNDARGRTTELRQYKSGNPEYGASPSTFEALKYNYNPAGKLVRATDAAGNSWSWEYDLLGRQTKAVDPDKGTTLSTYNHDGTLATTTDARAKTLAYTYDELGRKTSKLDGSAGGPKLAEWTYDTLPGGKGLPVSSIRYENGNAYTNAVTAYDNAARPTGSSVTIPTSEGALAGPYNTSQTYTPDTGLVATSTYPAGGGLAQETVNHSYTPLGLPTSLDNGNRLYSLGNQYSPTGQLLQTILGNVGSRVVQTYYYEDATQRLASVQSDREAVGPQTLDTKTYTYDPTGKITRVRNARDDVASVGTECYTYDSAQRMTNAWTATDDCVTKPAPGVLPKVGGVDPYWTSYTFDAAGNRTQETTRTSGAPQDAPLDTSKVTSVSLASGPRTTAVALADGKIWLAQQRNDGTWNNFEDLHAKAGALATVEHMAAVWCDGTLQVMAIAGGKIWHTIRKADGIWQAWGDVTSVVGALASPSQLALAATASGLEVLTFSNGVLQHTVREPGGGWSSWGNVFGETGTLGSATRVTSAATANGLEVVVIAGGKVWHTIRWTTGSWQRWGDVYSVTGPLTAPTQATVTATNAGLEVVALAGGTIFHTVRRPDASWQLWGNVSSAVGPLSQPLWGSVVNSGGDLKLLVAAGGTLNYTKRSAVTNSWLAWTQLPQSSQTQTADPVQRSSTYPAPGGALPHALSRVDTTGPGARTDTFTYDATGNTIRRVTAGGDQALEWNSEGRLAKSSIGGKETTFLYDADGNRLLRRDPDATTLYLSGQELKLTKATNQVTGTRFIAAGLATIVKGSDGSLNYLLADQQNTGQVTVDANSLAYTRTTTTPFGGPRGAQPASRPTDKGFVGGTTDASTGLTHLGAREYDVANGRFISVDPIMDLTDAQQINGYAYSNNDPVNFSDPSGLIKLTFWEGGGGARGGRGGGSEGGAGGEGGRGGNGRTSSEAMAEESLAAKEARLASEARINLAGEGRMMWDMKRARATKPGSATTTLPSPPKSAPVSTTKGSAPRGTGTKPSSTSRPSSKGSENKYHRDKWGDETLSDGVHDAVTSSDSGGTCSFTPETRVLMEDGTTKAIGDIREGDRVQAADPSTGQPAEGRAVTATWLNHDEDLVDLQVQAEAGAAETLHTTAEHPFWDDTAKAWTPAGQLTAGHSLQTAAGAHVTVLAVQVRPGSADMYNLTVAQLHTYYVLAGTTPVLVHNSCGPVKNSKADDLPFEQMAADFEGVTKISAGTPEFTQAAAGNGSYLWTVGEGGELNMVRSSPGIHHTIASGGEPVMAAGQVTFNGGRVTSFDNMTGHYTPTPECACVFIQRGVDAFAAQGVRIPLNAIRDYGGMAP
ncbi:polymorphic toxin-type HINT domain-containing protein [Kitasatospora herbaricolor]|uniref:polymorphic toxin-type HINT domain-containing protein n=1 Tax=Kitasatospora herbaricolor TaxID=68217 RepID=UPI0036DD4D48